MLTDYVDRMDGFVPGKFPPENPTENANALPDREAWNLFKGSLPENKVWRDKKGYVEGRPGRTVGPGEFKYRTGPQSRTGEEEVALVLNRGREGVSPTLCLAFGAKRACPTSVPGDTHWILPSPEKKQQTQVCP